MNRRNFLASALALAIFGCAPQPSDAAEPFRPTRFTVELRGSGPDVILIPGLTGSREVWSATVAAVPGYRYHLVQVAGFAGLPAAGNAEGPVVAPLAEEIGRYIAAKRLERPAIVGHSMGGTVAMMIAARTPDKAGRIMVVDMLPQPSGLFGSNAAAMGGLADRLRGIAGTPGGRRLFESLLSSYATDRGSDPDVVGRAMHELASTDLTAELPRISAPLTIVYGGYRGARRTQADADYAAGYRAAPRARLVPIEGSGHMVMDDQPERFHTALREFLTR